MARLLKYFGVKRSANRVSLENLHVEEESDVTHNYDLCRHPPGGLFMAGCCGRERGAERRGPNAGSECGRPAACSPRAD